MNIRTAAALLALSVPVAFTAHAQSTGVSTPPPETTPAQLQPATSISDPGLPAGYQPTPQRRELRPNGPTPSATGATSETYAPYHPATPPATKASLAGTPVGDPDGIIVADTPSATSQSEAGTLLRVRVHETLSTETNHAGDPFTATVLEPIYQDNRLLIPRGSILEGRITEVHGGHRIRGAAALHLDPRRLVLPDGTHYDLHAQLIDTSQSFATSIDSEGTLYRRDHIKETVAALGIATGTGAVAGAVLGGGVGAGVGALVGAGVGTAWWLRQDRQTVLPKDTNLVFTLNDPILAASVAR